MWINHVLSLHPCVMDMQAVFHSLAVKKYAAMNILKQLFKRKSVLKVTPRELKFCSVEVIFTVRIQNLLRRVSLILLVKEKSELAFPSKLSGARGSGPDGEVPPYPVISARFSLSWDWSPGAAFLVWGDFFFFLIIIYFVFSTNVLFLKGTSGTCSSAECDKICVSSLSFKKQDFVK